MESTPLVMVSRKRKSAHEENRNLEVVDKRKKRDVLESKHTARVLDANKCNKCKKSFTTKSNLSKHTKICGQTVDDRRSLMLFCDHCVYKTVWKSSLMRHIQSKHLPRDNDADKCERCKKSYSTRSTLLRHLKNCRQLKKVVSFSMLSCDHCDYKSDHKSHLVDHIKAQHLPRDPDANKCGTCDKSFSTRINLLAHTKICGQSEGDLRSLMFFCDHCVYKTVWKSTLIRHIQSKHLPRDNNANKCEKCKKSFWAQSSLSRHLKNCKKSAEDVSSLMFSCDYCDYESIRKSNLAVHIKAKHSTRDSKAYICKKCKKIFSCQSYLLTHSKICGQPKDVIRSVKGYSCDICEYESIRKCDLDRHIQTKHLPGDPDANKCIKCDKTYFDKSNLRRHLKVCGQSKDVIRSLKRYSCDSCDYKCNRKPDLERHIQKKHSPRDPDANKCIKCDKTYYDNWNLRRHLKICKKQ